jgi:hypothetical protein
MGWATFWEIISQRYLVTLSTNNLFARLMADFPHYRDVLVVSKGEILLIRFWIWKLARMEKSSLVFIHTIEA